MYKLKMDIVLDKLILACLAIYLNVYGISCDPDFEERDSNEQDKDDRRTNNRPNYRSAVTYYTWSGAVVGVLLFIVFMCFIAGWIYSCVRKRRQQRDIELQSRDEPKIFTLHPPSYISHDPPPYSAPDYSKTITPVHETSTKKKQKAQISPNNAATTSGTVNGAYVSETNNLPNSSNQTAQTSFINAGNTSQMQNNGANQPNNITRNSGSDRTQPLEISGYTMVIESHQNSDARFQNPPPQYEAIVHNVNS